MIALCLLGVWPQLPLLFLVFILDREEGAGDNSQLCDHKFLLQIHS